MRWKTAPLQYVAQIDPSKSEISGVSDDTVVSFLPMDAVGFGTVFEPPEERPLGELRSGYTYLADGDVAFAKISPSFQNGKSGQADDLCGGIAMATTELTVLRPTPTVDARFLQYVLRSDDFLRRGTATMHGVAGQQRVSSAFVAGYVVPVPPLAVQRRIADFLDTETARIDTLLATNHHAATLLEERLLSASENLMLGQGTDTPLWLLAELLPGYAYRSTDFAPDGEYRLLRGVNVSPGALRWKEAAWADSQVVAGTEGYALADGDIVMGMDRPWIGSGLRAAMVTSLDLEAGPIRLVQRVLRIRVRDQAIRPNLLLQWLRTSAFFSTFEPNMTGVSVPHVSSGQVGAALIPVPAPQVQDDLSEHLSRIRRDTRAARAGLGYQASLLIERRQALITAAVTGELEV